MYTKCVILKDALQSYAKEDEVMSPSSSSGSGSITEFTLLSTSLLCNSKTDNASSPSGTDFKPLLQSRSGTRLTERSHVSRVTSLPLLHQANTSPITTDVKQTKSFNANMVKFTSLSSTLMNKGKLQSSSGKMKPNLVSVEKTFHGDNCIVPDDGEQMSIHFSSDVEMPIVLESVGSHDDLTTSPVMPSHNPLVVDNIKEDKEEEGNFFSSEYGPIISAAQSTTILYSATELTASFLMDTGSADSSQTDLAKGFATNTLYIHNSIQSYHRDIGQKISVMIDLLLQRGANPDLSACPLPSIMYPILASDVTGVTRVARKSSKDNKVIVHDEILTCVSVISSSHQNFWSCIIPSIRTSVYYCNFCFGGVHYLR